MPSKIRSNSPPTTTSTRQEASLRFDVAVVGAGLSGLAAADTLSHNKKSVEGGQNLSVCVVEARNRVGGRVETNSNGFDVGGQWIGPTHGELLKLVQRYNLTLEEQYYGPESPASTTQRLTECVGFSQLALATAHQAEVRHYLDQLEQLLPMVDVHAPWMHPQANVFDTQSFADHIRANITGPDAQAEVLLFAQTLMASCPESVSFLFALFYLASGGGLQTLGDGPDGAQKWKLRGGMAALYDCIKGDLQARANKTRFFLDSPVERVTTTDDGVVRLDIQGGRRIYCNHVVFAIPPMLLSGIQFDPPLSPDRQALTRAMVGGKVIKVILTYERAFWMQQPPQPANFASQQAFLQGPLHNIFHGRGTTLVGLVTGACAEFFEKRNDLQECIARQIHAMYQVTDQALQFVEKRWASKDFSRGCFAGLFPPDGSFSRLGPLLRSREGKFCWASTETSPCWYGYVEGAILAGQRAGREVLSFLTRENQFGIFAEYYSAEIVRSDDQILTEPVAD